MKKYLYITIIIITIFFLGIGLMPKYLSKTKLPTTCQIRMNKWLRYDGKDFHFDAQMTLVNKWWRPDVEFFITGEVIFPDENKMYWIRRVAKYEFETSNEKILPYRMISNNKDSQDTLPDEVFNVLYGNQSTPRLVSITRLNNNSYLLKQQSRPIGICVAM